MKIFKNINITLKGYKYPELTSENGKHIILDLYRTIENSNNKKNIIIKFEKSFINEFIIFISKLKTDKPFILFSIQEKDYNIENKFNNFKDNKYISYMNESEKDDPIKYYCKIITYILEKTCYYKELGNKLCKYFPGNLIYKEPKGFFYFNVLLIGESRAGKSSFINKTLNKLVSYESSKFESTTLDINSYELYPKEEDNKNTFKKGYGGIRFYDTPGLVKTKDLDSFKKIKNNLKKVFNKIHIIYFFIKSQSNLEQSIDMLKYIKEINQEREKKQINKIPIIFIKNGEDLRKDEENPIIFKELKKILQKYNLMELYDSSIIRNNKQIEYNVDNFFEKEEYNEGNYEKYIEGNIIQIYIPDGKNISKIFSLTKEYLIMNNEFLLYEEFIPIKNDAKILINFYIKEKLQKINLSDGEYKKKEELFKKCSNIISDFNRNCSILYNLDELTIKSKALKYLGIFGGIICSICSGLIIPFFLSIYFLKLFDENIINNTALKYGFGGKILYDYGLSQYINGIGNSKEMSGEKFQKKCNEFFEDLIYYIGPIQFLIKSRELFDQILNLLEELKNKKDEDWNKFKIEKI